MSTQKLQSEQFTIKFDGNENQLDAFTLINSLYGFATLIQEINYSITPDKKVDVKINALKPGSFCISCEMIEYASIAMKLFPPAAIIASGIIEAGGAKYLAQVLELVIEFIKLKRVLGDRKPKVKSKDNDKGTVTIATVKGDVIINQNTYNLYLEGEKAHQAVSKGFKSLNLDDAVNNVDLYNKDGKNLLTVKREEFSELAKNIEFDTDNTQQIIKVANLTILKIVFDRTRMWEFVYNSKKISAKIEDENFHKMVSSRDVGFWSGDKLKVKLLINQKYEETADTFIDKDYTILEVLDHEKMEASIQKDLFEK